MLAGIINEIPNFGEEISGLPAGPAKDEELKKAKV
jgi:hypothetical protein